MDFKIGECRSQDEVKSVLDRYVKFYNEQRPCYVVGYDTPVNYRKRYYFFSCLLLLTGANLN